jgi:hypothetical protein
MSIKDFLYDVRNSDPEATNFLYPFFKKIFFSIQYLKNRSKRFLILKL